MIMELLVGSLREDRVIHTQVIFDSHKPHASIEILGDWWEKEIHLNPHLIKVGAIITDGTRLYEVLQIRGDLFDVGGSYHQRQNIIGQTDVVVFIAEVQYQDEGPVYTIFFDHQKQVLSEANLLKFLTEPAPLHSGQDEIF